MIKQNKVFLESLEAIQEPVRIDRPSSIKCSLADPGFGQGGGAEILSEILPTKRSKVRRAKQANIGQGQGLALGPWKFLHF